MAEDEKMTVSDEENVSQQLSETPEIPETPVDGRAEVIVRENGKRAEIHLYEPQHGGASVSKDMMHSALAEQKVVFGILEDVLTKLTMQPVYDQPMVVAEAKLAVRGQDGYVEYLFDLDDHLKPIEDDQGIVDFKNLNFIRNVDKDQRLANIIPPTEGVDGCDVWGQVLEAEDGTPVLEINGDNTYLSEDGSAVFAACAGSPKIKNKKVMVSRVITVDNVDISTGNLLYVGSIIVRGNVCDGFTVSASEGIDVKGTVENGKLISGRNITVSQGISGSQSRVIAGGDIRSGFLENCIVEAKGDIYAEAILHADIKCEGKVHVSGRRGCIIGGACRAAHSITAKDIGNEKYIPTTVEVYGTYFLDNKLEELKKKLAAQTEELKKDDELLEKLAMLQRLQQTLPANAMENAQFTRDQHQKKLSELEEEIARQSEIIANFEECSINVEGRLYENVTLIIKDVKEESDVVRGRCTAFLSGDQIAYR